MLHLGLHRKSEKEIERNNNNNTAIIIPMQRSAFYSFANRLVSYCDCGCGCMRLSESYGSATAAAVVKLV